MLSGKRKAPPPASAFDRFPAADFDAWVEDLQAKLREGLNPAPAPVQVPELSAAARGVIEGLPEKRDLEQQQLGEGSGNHVEEDRGDPEDMALGSEEDDEVESADSDEGDEDEGMQVDRRARQRHLPNGHHSAEEDYSDEPQSHPQGSRGPPGRRDRDLAEQEESEEDEDVSSEGDDGSEAEEDEDAPARGMGRSSYAYQSFPPRPSQPQPQTQSQRQPQPSTSREDSPEVFAIDDSDDDDGPREPASQQRQPTYARGRPGVNGSRLPAEEEDESGSGSGSGEYSDDDDEDGEGEQDEDDGGSASPRRAPLQSRVGQYLDTEAEEEEEEDASDEDAFGSGGSEEDATNHDQGEAQDDDSDSDSDIEVVQDAPGPRAATPAQAEAEVQEVASSPIVPVATVIDVAMELREEQPQAPPAAVTASSVPVLVLAEATERQQQASIPTNPFLQSTNNESAAPIPIPPANPTTPPSTSAPAPFEADPSEPQMAYIGAPATNIVHSQMLYDRIPTFQNLAPPPALTGQHQIQVAIDYTQLGYPPQMPRQGMPSQQPPTPPSFAIPVPQGMEGMLDPQLFNDPALVASALSNMYPPSPSGSHGQQRAYAGYDQEEAEYSDGARGYEEDEMARGHRVRDFDEDGRVGGEEEYNDYSQEGSTSADRRRRRERDEDVDMEGEAERGGYEDEEERSEDDEGSDESGGSEESDESSEEEEKEEEGQKEHDSGFRSSGPSRPPLPFSTFPNEPIEIDDSDEDEEPSKPFTQRQRSRSTPPEDEEDEEDEEEEAEEIEEREQEEDELAGSHDDHRSRSGTPNPDEEDGETPEETEESEEPEVVEVASATQSPGREESPSHSQDSTDSSSSASSSSSEEEAEEIEEPKELAPVEADHAMITVDDASPEQSAVPGEDDFVPIVDATETEGEAGMTEGTGESDEPTSSSEDDSEASEKPVEVDAPIEELSAQPMVIDEEPVVTETSEPVSIEQLAKNAVDELAAATSSPGIELIPESSDAIEGEGDGEERVQTDMVGVGEEPVPQDEMEDMLEEDKDSQQDPELSEQEDPSAEDIQYDDEDEPVVRKHTSGRSSPPTQDESYNAQIPSELETREEILKEIRSHTDADLPSHAMLVEEREEFDLGASPSAEAESGEAVEDLEDDQDIEGSEGGVGAEEQPISLDQDLAVNIVAEVANDMFGEAATTPQYQSGEPEVEASGPVAAQEELKTSEIRPGDQTDLREDAEEEIGFSAVVPADIADEEQEADMRVDTPERAHPSLSPEPEALEQNPFELDEVVDEAADAAEEAPTVAEAGGAEGQAEAAKEELPEIVELVEHKDTPEDDLENAEAGPSSGVGLENAPPESPTIDTTHHHGNALNRKTAPAASSSSSSSQAARPMDSPAARTRSHCQYHAVRFGKGAESYTVLAPFCSIGAELDKFDAVDLGEATVEQRTQAQSMQLQFGVGSTTLSIGRTQIPEVFEHLLRKVVGADILREGACYLLQEGTGVVLHEDDRATLGVQSSPYATHRPNTTIMRSPSGPDKGKRRASSTESVASSSAPASPEVRKRKREGSAAPSEEDPLLDTPNKRRATGQSPGRKLSPVPEMEQDAGDKMDVDEEVEVAAAPAAGKKGWLGWLWGRK